MAKCTSYFMTEKECTVFNEINLRFTKGEFGCERFNRNDVLVEFGELCQFYDYVDDCVLSNRALEIGLTKGGWLQINNTVMTIAD